MKYRPRHFVDVSESKLGRDLWRFLNSRKNAIRLETATDLRHPAVAGVERVLLERFGAALRRDRVKQTIGHMVRQIMEARGFRLDRTRVNVRRGKLFLTGSRYTRN